MIKGTYVLVWVKGRNDEPTGMASSKIYTDLMAVADLKDRINANDTNKKLHNRCEVFKLEAL